MHLGSPHGWAPSLDRERHLVRWLDEVAPDARAIYLAGDVFDFWFEYKKVVPKGFTRFLGKLGELTDRGIEIHLFMGNHDMWMTGYLEKECGVQVHRRGETVELYGKKIYIDHGNRIMDREHPGSYLLGRCFHSPVLRWLFSRLVHPTYALRFGQWWSARSRVRYIGRPYVFQGEAESLVKYARGMLAAGEAVDYFVFGHIHCAEDYNLDGEGRRAIFTGDWLHGRDYAVLSPDGRMELKKFL
jgi:UDP-2,3-diacylglucosamine hydrolase